MSNENQLRSKVVLLRVAVWGQIVGYLLAALFLAIEDAPDILVRVSIWEIVVPIAAGAAIRIKRVSNFLVRNLSTSMLAVFVIIISFSTAAIALGDVTLSFAIPDFLVTPGWQNARTTGLITLAVFIVALVTNIALAVRALRINTASDTPLRDPLR